jgi:hypothetical protein
VSIKSGVNQTNTNSRSQTGKRENAIIWVENCRLCAPPARQIPSATRHLTAFRANFQTCTTNLSACKPDHGYEVAPPAQLRDGPRKQCPERTGLSSFPYSLLGLLILRHRGRRRRSRPLPAFASRPFCQERRCCSTGIIETTRRVCVKVDCGGSRSLPHLPHQRPLSSSCSAANPPSTSRKSNEQKTFLPTPGTEN